jgi:hypothetical protein
MTGEWRSKLAARRIKPGDGRPLKRFRWWQMLTRSLYYLPPMDFADRRTEYAVDVRHGGNATTGEIEAQLYVDGALRSVSRLPSMFPVEGGGRIEVAASTFGLKRCHWVRADGSEQQLIPDPDSAEGRRARLDKTHPAASRWVGRVTTGVLVVAVGTLVPQLVETVSLFPPVAENLGAFDSPVDLPAWANVVVTIGAAFASTERALRLRYHWLLDGAAG